MKLSPLFLLVVFIGLNFSAFADPCIPMKTGEVRLVNERSEEVPSKRYLLTLEQNGSYTVGIPIRFTAAQPTVNIPAFEAYVRHCYDEFSNHLNSSSGPLLRFRYLSPAEVKGDVPLNDVVLDQSLPRANSRSYNPTIDHECSTIIHEGLHLLGLVDEYEEYDSAAAPGMNCRFVPGIKTIMSASKSTYEDVTGVSQKCSCGTNAFCQKTMEKESLLKKIYLRSSDQRSYIPKWLSAECKAVSQIARNMPLSDLAKLPATFPVEHVDHKSLSYAHIAGLSEDTLHIGTFVCTCGQFDQNCKDRLPKAAAWIQENFNKGAVGSCPPSSISEGGLMATPLDDYSESAVYKDGKFTVKTLPTKSLLVPEHVKKIIAGSCKNPALNYDECARWAYKGTRTVSCDRRPQKCFDDRHYLGVDW